MERPFITAVVHSAGEAKIRLAGLVDRPGSAGRVLSALAEANIVVDTIVQNAPATKGRPAEMSFTVRREDLREARTALSALEEELDIASITTDARMAKLSLLGAGMRTHPHISARAFSALGEADVNIEMITTSPIEVSCVVSEGDLAAAVSAIQRTFELSADAVVAR